MSDWKEEYDRLIDTDLCLPAETLLRSEDYPIENTDFFRYPESEYELDPDKVKDFIEKVESQAYERGIKECIEALRKEMAASDVERKYVQITLQGAIKTLKSLLK